jgi:hypothetical protein
MMYHVIPGKSIERVAWDGSWFAEQVWHAIIWSVVLVLQEVTQGELRRRAEAKRHGRCDTHPPQFDLVAIDNIFSVSHKVDTERRRVIEPLIDVACGSDKKPFPKLSVPP